MMIIPDIVTFILYNALVSSESYLKLIMLDKNEKWH